MDPLDLDLVEASEAIADGSLDPVELTEAYLRRIEETESGPHGLNAWYTVDAEGAKAAAATAAAEVRSGRLRGPLHGIPVGIKDLFDTAGLRTTYGSIRFRDHVPTTDAVAVARLREAGAVVLGKQATHEFAWGGRTDNPHFGPTHNPHSQSRIPGGSSGGAGASVAARSSLLALGSDTAGSVRIPAALSGCVGFKPTYGWLPTTGAFPLAPSLDHVGLLTRTVRDAALAFDALAGRTEPSRDEPRIRVGFVGGESAELVDGEVATALALARHRLEGAGVEVSDVRLTRVSERVRAVLTLVFPDAEQVHHDMFAEHPESYGPDLARLLSRGPLDPAEVAAARRVVDEAVRELRAVLDEVDVVMSATVPIVAPHIGEMSVDLKGVEYPVELLLTRLTSLANAAGAPAVSVPAPGVRELPVGVQLVGRPGEEATVLRTAALLEPT
jgi:aspartyl-tRNA(Asn)/glutamyl-tRNA(Gln) amidotransferase subunit A